MDCSDDVWAVSVDWCMNVKGCRVDLAISLDDFSLTFLTIFSTWLADSYTSRIVATHTAAGAAMCIHMRATMAEATAGRGGTVNDCRLLSRLDALLWRSWSHTGVVVLSMSTTPHSARQGRCDALGCRNPGLDEAAGDAEAQRGDAAANHSRRN